MKTLRLISAGILLLGLILLIVDFIPSIPELLGLVNNNPTYTSSDPTTSGTTPCWLTFNYVAKVEAEGPVKIVYPGVSDTIYWDGKSEIPDPPRKKGAVYFCSNNPNKPNLWVKVWKQ